MKKIREQKNYRVKIAIFSLAFIFWLMVKLNKPYDYTVEIPLNVIINNTETWLKYPPPDSVRVEFSGRGFDLLRLSFYQPRYNIDLSAESDEVVFNLTEHREFVSQSKEVNVDVKSVVSPIEIRFDIDARREKKVPVDVKTKLKTANGFILVRKVTRPDSIIVIGPATMVDTLSRVSTESRSYQKVDLAFNDRLKLLKHPRFFAKYVPEVVAVFFDVQRLAEKEIPGVPVTVINVPENLEVVPLPMTAEIYVKGGEKELADAEAEHFSVVIDFKKDWKPGVKRVMAGVTTELTVSYMETRPASFELIVQKKRG